MHIKVWEALLYRTNDPFPPINITRQGRKKKKNKEFIDQKKPKRYISQVQPVDFSDKPVIFLNETLEEIWTTTGYLSILKNYCYI